MVNPKKIKLEASDIPRRRGRPVGKNRIPLSREERRARNAQYERERRNETAEVMSQLTEAANCDPNISNAELLATVINKIQRATRKKVEDITELEHVNANLEGQIAKLQGRLGLDGAALELIDDEDTATDTNVPHSRSKRNINSKNCNSENNNLRKQRKKRKRSERLSSESIKPEKRTKTRSETLVVGSGIKMRDHTVSPPAVCDQDKMNIQFRVKTKQQQLPEEITEEADHGECQEHIELQTELYNQIYNSESQSSEESMTKFVATLSAQSQSIPSIERLTRSLIVVPPIVPPQEVPPDSQEHTQSDLMSLQNDEVPCDLSLKNECDFLQQNDDQEPTLDFLTDAEKRLVTDWIGANFLETSEFCDGSQMQVKSYSAVGVDKLSGY